MALTDKQERFCQEYLIDLNATQAAIRAGYSTKTAQEQSSRLLSNVIIQNRIAELKEQLSETTQITQIQVIKEIAKVAFGDIATLFDESGALLPIQDMPQEARAVIASVKTYEEKAVIGEETITRGTIREVKQWDKLKALDMLGRHLGLYKQDNDQKKTEPISLDTLSAIAAKINQNGKNE